MTNEEAKQLEPGDRVEIEAEWVEEDEPVEGTFKGPSGEDDDDLEYLVERDDDVPGGGDNGEWLCGAHHLTRLGNEDAKEHKSAGHKFKVGDRVKYTELAFTPGVCGTVVGYKYGNVCVKRDDSYEGSGPDGSWTSKEYALELLKAVDEDEVTKAVWEHHYSVEPSEREDAFDVREAIKNECEELKELLLEKNESYGNSVFEPCEMSGLSVKQRLLVRIGDKIKRLKAGHEYPTDDTTKDLIGYLILLRIADKREAATL